MSPIPSERKGEELIPCLVQAKREQRITPLNECIVALPLSEIPDDLRPQICISNGLVAEGIPLCLLEGFMPVCVSEIVDIEKEGTFSTWGLEEISFENVSQVLSLRLSGRLFRLHIGESPYYFGGLWEANKEQNFCNEVRWLIASFLMLKKKMLAEVEKRGIVFVNKRKDGEQGEMVLALPEEVLGMESTGEEGTDLWLVYPHEMMGQDEMQLEICRLFNEKSGRVRPVGVILK